METASGVMFNEVCCTDEIPNITNCLLTFHINGQRDFLTGDILIFGVQWMSLLELS